MSLSLSRRRFLGLTAAGAAAAPFVSVASFADAAAPLAIRGYDVVAYFSLAKDADGVKGSTSHTTEYNGRTYRFASAENLATFTADPERFDAKYLGHCAWAASRGYIAPGDPEAWTVHDDRLYLNFNKSVRRRWRRDIPGNVAKADANWPQLRTEV